MKQITINLNKVFGAITVAIGATMIVYAVYQIVVITRIIYACHKGGC